MARTLYPKHGGFQFYSLAEWSLADNDAQNQTKPVAGDTIILTADSAQVLCNESWAAASLSHPGPGTSEWQFSTQTAVVSGDITLDKVTATIEAADITATNFDIGANGSLTFSDNAKITANIEVDGGTIDDGGYAVDLTGSFDNAGGTLTSTGTWTLSGTGNVTNNGYATPFGELILSGTITVVTGAFTAKATVTGTLGGAAAALKIVNPAANWWGTQTGVINCDVLILATGTGTMQPPGNPITLVDRKLSISSAGTHSCTWDADIITGTGDLEVYGSGPGDVLTLDLDDSEINCGGDLVIGVPLANTGSCILSMGSGLHRVGGIHAGDPTNSVNAQAWEDCSVINAGTFDGTDITVTSVGANLHGGTIQDADCTGVLHCWGVTDGTGNSVDVAHEGSNAGAALGGMMRMVA